MPKNSTGSRFGPRARAFVVIALLFGLFFSWALIEPRLRQNPISAQVLQFIERPLLVVGDLQLSLLFVIKLIVFLSVLGFLAGRARALLGALLQKGTELEPGQRYAIETAASYSIIILGCLIGLQSAGINLSSLAVVGGALGIGIGLGFQESANNFLSGLILLLERPIKVGDRVEVGSLDGDVVRIGSRATWVRTNANITVIVPNSEFVMRQVINWTATDRQVRFSLPVGVSYRANPAQVRDLLLEVARRNPDVLDSPEPDVLFKGFGDSSLDFQLRVWTQTKMRTPNILCSELYFAIFDELARHDIEIPYPQRDIHVRSSCLTPSIPISREPRPEAPPGQ